MINVRMIASITGLTDGIEIPQPGGEVKLPDRTAREMIAQGYAVAVGSIEKPAPAPVDKGAVTGKRNQRDT